MIQSMPLWKSVYKYAYKSTLRSLGLNSFHSQSRLQPSLFARYTHRLLLISPSKEPAIFESSSTLLDNVR